MRDFEKQLTEDILNKMKKKKRLWRKLKACPSEAHSRKLREFRRSVTELIRSEYKGYLQHLSSQLKVNQKRFWSYLSIKAKSKRLPEIKSYNGRLKSKLIYSTVTFTQFFL